jgi:phospholipid-translocating ATPase
MEVHTSLETHDAYYTVLLTTPTTLQVRATLETLRDANIKTWMLTGDKLETAMAIARNASLVPRRQPFYPVRVRCAAEVRQQLHGYPKGVLNAPCLLLDGTSLEYCVTHQHKLFMEVACSAPTVICCRCAPTQKAEVVRLIRNHTKLITAAIGDGGNDVAMIQAGMAAVL